MSDPLETLPDRVKIQSVTLCIVASMPTVQLNEMALDRTLERYETRYHDTGEIQGFSLFTKVGKRLTGGLFEPLDVLARPAGRKSDTLHVRIVLDPASVRELFRAQDFEAWDTSVRFALEASLNRPLDNTWKRRCGFVLVVEDANLFHLPVDAQNVYTYGKQWLRFFGVDNTVAYPYRFGETIFISAPRVMGEPSDRVICAITRPHPSGIKSADLPLAASIEALLSCWAEIIPIETIRAELTSAPFFGRSVSEYLGKIGWHKSRRKRMAQYEERYLRDREQALDLVMRARRGLNEAESKLKFNPFRRLPQIAVLLPVGKPSSAAYPVSAVVASTIETPLTGAVEDIAELEIREKGLSDYLRDAASAHIERANWNVQWAMIIMTITTILFGAATLYLDWRMYSSSRGSANQPSVSVHPKAPEAIKAEPSGVPRRDSEQ